MKRVALLSAMLSMALMMPAQQAFYDCSDAYIICTNDPIPINHLLSNTNGTNLMNTSCLKEGIPASNSMWFKWKMKSSGNLGFLLVPLDENDDLDFILYKLTDGLDNCDSKEDIRCMASGENRGEGKVGQTSKCSGVTGLSNTSSDIIESPGCAASNDNFLAEIQAKEGDEYALWVNNYYSSNGFILEFTGGATFAPIIEHCKDNENNTSETVELNDLLDKGLYIKPIYPNPARSEIALPVFSDKTYQDGQLQVISLHGDIMQIKSLVIVPGTNDVNVNIGNLPVGIYFLKVVLGDNIHVARFGKF